MARADHAVAAAEYEHAHALTEDPVLLFKAAGAHDAAGNCEAARAFYERYLAEGTPDDGFRRQAEARIAAARGGACGDPARSAGAGGDADGGGADGAGGDADGAASGSALGAGDAAAALAGDSDAAAPEQGPPPGPLQGPPSFADQEPSWQRSAAWISVGATAALVTAGAMLAMSAESREEDLDYLIRYRDLGTDTPARYAGQIQERYDTLIDEGERLARYSRLTFAAAGVAAAAAAVFFIIDPSSGSSSGPSSGPSSESSAGAGQGRAPATARRHVAPGLVPGGLGVVAGWEF